MGTGSPGSFFVSCRLYDGKTSDMWALVQFMCVVTVVGLMTVLVWKS